MRNALALQINDDMKDVLKYVDDVSKRTTLFLISMIIGRFKYYRFIDQAVNLCISSILLLNDSASFDINIIENSYILRNHVLG